MPKFFLPLLFLTLTSSASAALPSAQGEFVHRNSVTPGCNGLVTSSATLANGDVIFGGNFTQCAAVRANRVVRFDGVNFHSVGSGTENGVSGVVRAVFVDGNKIYAGGDFNTAGNAAANNVAVFDGTVWRSVGRGSSNGIPGVVVRALQVFDGKLFAGGHTDDFGKAFLREWNGASWREVVAFARTDLNDSVNALAVMNNALYFGGTFRPLGANTHQNLGLYSGNVVSYSDFPTGTAFSRVRDLHPFQGQMCVAGSFSLVANQPAGVACRGPNGWQGYGLNSMRALTDNGTTLFAAGYDFSGTGTVHAVGQSSFIRAERAFDDFVLTLATQGNGLLVGGGFAQTITPAHALLRLNQGQFEPLSGGAVPNLSSSLAYFAAAGSTALAWSYNQPHPAPSPTLLQRIGERWLPIAAPTSSTDLSATFLLSSGSQIYLMDTNVRTLYRWNGIGWDTAGLNMQITGTYGETLISVDFANAQGERYVSRLGANGLEPFLTIPPLRRNGELLNASTNFPLTLVQYLGKPVIAGQFDFIDGFGPINGIAIYEDGVWRQLGGGLRDPKWASTQQFLQINLLAVGNELYASNGFTEAEGVPVDGIARFDGTRWHAMGAGLMQSDAVAARAQVKMVRYHDKLYAYGVFDRADRQEVNNVAQWDSGVWRALGPVGADGLQSEGSLLAVVVGEELHFSGEIHAAGAQPAEYYAVWRDELMFASGFE